MSLRNLKTFDSLRTATFRIYYLGMVGQWAALSMQTVVQALLLYRLTGSTALLGTMALATSIPQVIVALFTGVIVDRFSKKRLIQIGQAVAVVPAITIAVLIKTGYLNSAHHDSWWILICASIIQGMASSLLWSARLSIIPELVNKTQLANATALNTVGMNIFQMIAPAVGGFLIDKVNFEAVFLTISGLYVVSICITNFIPASTNTPTGKGNVLADMVAGFKYVKNNNVLILILAYSLLCSMVVLPLSSMISVYSDSILKVGATGLGLLQGFKAGGSMLTVFWIASLAMKKRSLLMLGTGLTLGLAQAAFAFSTSFQFSLFLMIFVGMGTMGQITLAMIQLQTYSEPAQRGRVLSILLLGAGLGGLMTFGSGFLAEAIGIQWTIGGMALILAAATILILFLVPRLRKLD
jgi:MFS family permease